MPQFNQRAVDARKTVNHENAQAWTLEPALALYCLVCTMVTMGDKFYESAGDQLSRIRELVSQVPEEFVCQLAVYAREQMHLRSIPLVLCVELARVNATRSIKTSLLSKTVTRVIQRADEITELLAYYQSANERTGEKKLGKISNQIAKGIAEAFKKFGGFQLAKYNRPGDITLRDALFLVHPQAKDAEQQASFNELVSGTLKTPDTWETALTAAGASEDVEGAEAGNLGTPDQRRQARLYGSDAESPQHHRGPRVSRGAADRVSIVSAMPMRSRDPSSCRSGFRRRTG